MSRDFKHIIWVSLLAIILSFGVLFFGWIQRISYIYDYKGSQILENLQFFLLTFSGILLIILIVRAAKALKSKELPNKKKAFSTLIVLLSLSSFFLCCKNGYEPRTSCTMIPAIVVSKDEKNNRILVRRENDETLISLQCTNSELNLVNAGSQYGAITYTYYGNDSQNGYLTNLTDAR